MLTRRENLELVGRLYHPGRAERRQRAGRVLEHFQLACAADRPGADLFRRHRGAALPADLVTGRRPDDQKPGGLAGQGGARCSVRPQCLAFALRTGFCSQVGTSG